MVWKYEQSQIARARYMEALRSAREGRAGGTRGRDAREGRAGGTSARRLTRTRIIGEP